MHNALLIQLISSLRSSFLSLCLLTLRLQEYSTNPLIAQLLQKKMISKTLTIFVLGLLLAAVAHGEPRLVDHEGAALELRPPSEGEQGRKILQGQGWFLPPLEGQQEQVRQVGQRSLPQGQQERQELQGHWQGLPRVGSE